MLLKTKIEAHLDLVVGHGGVLATRDDVVIGDEIVAGSCSCEAFPFRQRARRYFHL
jgi:hypothetical protein